ncbi:MAG: carboxymuconolactone decarboxylase family protein [Bacteroidetes bacterium]|nr:carboxymuconolactone decarboxylase family protein [Rhodothermaceae bacterium RA]RMH65809.1 MAG: carboxymuconolactone decarboxylase family protein [Bacteroidota bacterium]
MNKQAPADRLAAFEAYRDRLNHRILEEKSHLGIKRFFNLDAAAYRDGALDRRTKELLGLVASMVLRCNDCIDYHLIQCVDLGFTDDELDEAMNVALVVGGSIVIPHLRHAVDTLDLLRARAAERENTKEGEALH